MAKPKGLKRYNLFVFAVLALFIVLVLPTFTRFYESNDSLIGSEPYYHLRAAKRLMQEQSINIFTPPEGIPDSSYSPRDYFFNPYHYMLVFTSRFTSLANASRILPFVLGLISVLLFNLILKSFVTEDYKRHLILLMLALSPAFIYTFTISTPHSAAIVISLAGLCFFIREGRYNLALSILCFALVALFSLFNTILIILVMLAYVLTKRKMQNRFIALLFLLAIFSFAKRVSFYYNYTFSPNLNIVSNLSSDLGGIIGFGIFSIALAIYGVAAHWKNKSSFLAFFFLSILLMLSLFFAGNVANMYLSFFVAVAAGIGFVRLCEMPWSVRTVKNLTLLIVICGLLFSSVSYLSRLSSMEPNPDIVDALVWLGDNTFKDRFVLSHYDEGFRISTIARNPVIVDSLQTAEYDQKFLYKVQDSIFYSRKLKDVKPLFQVYNIQYIFVTPEMRSGLVWSKPDEGLLFLFTSKSTFKKVYDKKGVEIWEVLNATGV